MTINYYGLSCLKLESSGVVIATNPYAKVSGLQAPRFEANIVLATQKSFTESSVAGEPFTISGPGEYDVKGVFVRGVFVTPTESIYLIEWDGIKTLFLGELKTATMEEAEKAVRLINKGIDMLILPVGSAFGSKNSQALVKLIEPRITIPTEFELKGVKEKREKLEAFLKIAGNKPKEEDKISVKQNSLPADKSELIVLASPAKAA